MTLNKLKDVRKYLLVILLCVLGYHLNAQITDAESKLKSIATDTVRKWNKGGTTNINFSQTSLTNWAAGGVSSYALNGMLNLYASYKDKKQVWDNTLDFGYGLMKQESTGYRKTDDRIELNSKYGRKAFSDFYYAALLNFKTQLSPGYNYSTNTKISDFLIPGYLVGALGLNYQPNKYISAFVAPVTSRFTIVTDTFFSKSFGLDPGKKLRTEFGGYARFAFTKNDFKTEILKNVSITSKLDLFSNYLDKPQNVDVNWENIIFLKVNKFITVSLNTNLIYDDNIKAIGSKKAKLQFKEILGVGFSYKF